MSALYSADCGARHYVSGGTRDKKRRERTDWFRLGRRRGDVDRRAAQEMLKTKPRPLVLALPQVSPQVENLAVGDGLADCWVPECRLPFHGWPLVGRWCTPIPLLDCLHDASCHGEEDHGDCVCW